MEIKNAKLSVIILAFLALASYGFFVSAQEKTSPAGNIFMDSDQDGLSDEEEALYRTDPLKTDTDGDGYSDSVEIKAGYNPLKPAPEDRIIPETAAAIPTTTAETGRNLTEEVAQKIAVLTAANTDGSAAEVSMDEVQQVVDEAIGNQEISPEDLPPIDLSELKIEKNTYANLSPEKAKAKQKEDFSKYITAIYYILASNSPRPITSSTDISSVLTSMIQQIISAITNQNSSLITDIDGNADKILEQIKSISVPEEFVEIHIKALQFAKYSLSLKQTIDSNPEDPLSDLANLSRIQGLAESLSGFLSETQTKMAELGLNYDDTIQQNIQAAGLPLLEEPVADSENEATIDTSTVINSPDVTQ